MESVLCIVAGVVTVGGAIALSFLRSPQWHNATWDDTPRSRGLMWWGSFQRRVRFSNNMLLAAIGLGVFAAAFVPDGRGRMALWLFIALGLLTTLFLAGIDALASMVGYRQAVPESERQALSRCEPHP